MSALSIQPTYPIFTETDGQPLENGYIWIGTVNLDPQVNPINIYWDAALTISAPQPIRTLGGYPSRNGTPARLYVNSDYSIRVMNKNGSTVYSAPAATERYGNVITLADLTFLQSGSGAVPRTALSKMRDQIEARDFGAVADLSTDNTAAIQNALDSLPNAGGLVVIPAGCRFDLTALTFRQNCNMQYYANDDLSVPGQASDIGSGELVYFSANSSWPSDPTGAAVNEWRFTAAFHPGVVVDVRKDVQGANAYLRPGQTLDNPVRASYNIMDEQTDAARLVYENYSMSSNFSMLQLHAYRRVVVLNGIGTAQWVTPPVEGDVVLGTTSGAVGNVISVSASATTLLWFSGRFIAGETVSDASETTTATITSAVYSATPFAPIAQGLYRGNWAIGLPADAVRDSFVVGGKIGSQRTRGGPFYENKSVLNPGFVWVDSYENATPNGFEAIYDTSVAANLRRVYWRKYNSNLNIGQVGAVSGHASINDAAGSITIRPGSFNIASVVRNGGTVGRYDVTFTDALPTANFRISTSAQFTGFITWDAKSTTGFSLFVYNAAGAAQWAPFDFDFTIVGGDI